MTCDYCGNENEDELIYGRWIVYCEKCKDTGGRDEDRKKVWENEACDGENLDGLDGEAEEIISELH